MDKGNTEHTLTFLVNSQSQSLVTSQKNKILHYD
jgi:hypothetical protein